MGDDQHGLGRSGEVVGEARLRGLVEPVGGLVEQQHLGVHRKHRAQGHQALLAGGQAMGDPIGETREPEQVQDPLRVRPSLIRAAPQVEGTEGEVFEHRGTEQLVVRVLEQEADPGAHLEEVRLRPSRPAECQDLTPIRDPQSHQEMQQGGLAGPVGSDQGHPLPAPQAQVDPRQDGSAPIAETDTAKLQQSRVAIRGGCHHDERPRARSAARSRPSATVKVLSAGAHSSVSSR